MADLELLEDCTLDTEEATLIAAITGTTTTTIAMVAGLDLGAVG